MTGYYAKMAEVDVLVGFLFAVGGIGFVVGLSCSLRRYFSVDSSERRKQGGWLCLTSDIAQKSFVAITFAGVLTLSLQFAVYISSSLGTTAAGFGGLERGLAGIENTLRSAAEAQDQALDELSEGQAELVAQLGQIRTGASVTSFLQRLVDSCLDAPDGGAPLPVTLGPVILSTHDLPVDWDFDLGFSVLDRMRDRDCVFRCERADGDVLCRDARDAR